MADLTITLVDAGLTAASQSWLISTCDVYGRPRTAHTATQQVVAPLSGQTTAGTATASLTPTANWVEDDVYYKFETAGYSRIFSKGSGTENLVATTQPTPVADAPAALRTTDLADWSPAAPTTDDVPIWDGTTWVPGAQSAGAMSAADILTAIKTVDGAGSGLDADLLDGQSAAAFEAAGTAAALVDDLSGVTNAATARTNLGLGTAATTAATDYAARASNLSDLASAATAFSNIKQAASDTATGVVELATNAETLTGTDTTRAVTPAGVAAIYPHHIAPATRWLGSNATRSTVAVTMSALGRELWTPLWLETGTYDRIAVYVITGATSTWRLGLDPMSASNSIPSGTPLLDAGTVDMSGAAGQRAITISFTVTTSGWFWAHAKVEAYTANPTVVATAGTASAAAGPPFFGWPTDEASYLRSFAGLAYNGGGSGGALTAAPSLTNNSATGLSYADNVPTFWFRKA